MLSNFSLKRLAQDYLASQTFEAGQTIQLGWFIFRVAGNSVPPELETLDFMKMASFTTDFSVAESIRERQTKVLERSKTEPEGCTLWQAALVSRSYKPGSQSAFLERQDRADGKHSGWYVGVSDEARDMNDINSFEQRSLYELSIADERMLPFWLLPVGRKVLLSSGDIEVT